MKRKWTVGIVEKPVTTRPIVTGFYEAKGRRFLVPEKLRQMGLGNKPGESIIFNLKEKTLFCNTENVFNEDL